MAIYRDAGLDPIITDKAPTGQDYASYGAIWIDQSLNDIYIATNSAAGLMVWTPCGGGAGQFSSLSVDPGDASIVSGDFEVTAGTVTIGAFGEGLVFSSAAGLLSAAAGTDGQIVVGATGAAPLWASLASSDGSVGIAVGANTIDLTVTGATGSSFPTDGAVVTPLAGATSIVGDTNITTDGVVANTVTINLNPSVSLVGKLTAGNDLEMTAGTCLIASDDNAANAIYLHTTGGVNEQINIHADAGTGAQSIYAHSDVGGVEIASGLAAASAINLNASDAAGGIGLTAGTNGVIAAITNGVFTVTTGTGNISIGADAFAHNCTLGSLVGTATTTLHAGTGGIVGVSMDEITLDCAGVLELNSSAGVIGIGNDAVAQNINIGTGAAARTVTIGNSSGASSVIVDCGTGNLDLGVTATAHTSRLGSTTGASATTVQAGTGALAINGGGAVTVDSVGALELNTSAGAINIATDAVAVVTTIGNVTGASQVVVDCGTAGATFGASATDHNTTLGGTTGGSSVTIQSGAGAIGINGGGVVEIDAVNNVEINTSAGAINIATDAVAVVTTIGNVTGASQVVVDCGTAGVSVGASATAHQTTLGSTDTTSATTVQAGTGALLINGGGNVSIDSAGVAELQSSFGSIDIGTDGVASIINVGNGTGATGVYVACGTGGGSFCATANEHLTTIGSLTGASSTVIQAGTDDLELTSTGEITLDAADVLELNCSGAAISIGNDADAFGINVGTGAAARTIEIGNNTGATAINLSAGTGEVNSDTDINLTTAGTGFVLQEGPRIIAGAGSPHGSVTAPLGSIYLNTTGSGVADRLWANTNGGTSWTNFTSAA